VEGDFRAHSAVAHAGAPRLVACVHPLLRPAQGVRRRAAKEEEMQSWEDDLMVVLAVISVVFTIAFIASN
jgi:hypothetical protein